MQMFGPPDDRAWERAHSYYTAAFDDKGYSDIQAASGCYRGPGMRVLVTTDAVGGVWTYTRGWLQGCSRRVSK